MKTNRTLSEKIPYPWMRRELILEKPCRRGDTGPRIKIIQEWLCLRGQNIKIDGDFGPATERAVTLFQTSHGLNGTGIVDTKTFAALTSPILRALEPAGRKSMSYNERVVSCALQHCVEYPREIGGENSGPWVRLYMRGNEGRAWPWCAGFVSFILSQADTTGRLMPLKPTFSCDILASEAKVKKIFISAEDIASGRLPQKQLMPGFLFVNRRTDGDWDHTGIVTAFNKETFETVEGNTNDAGEREGYEVCQRVRGYKGKDFIRITG